jgi:hypothetical protein
MCQGHGSRPGLSSTGELCGLMYPLCIRAAECCQVGCNIFSSSEMKISLSMPPLMQAESELKAKQLNNCSASLCVQQCGAVTPAYPIMHF